jgi:predicted dinucleotide-binding enzyme
MLVDLFTGKLATGRVYTLLYEGAYHISEESPPNHTFNLEWKPHRIRMIPQSQQFIDGVLKTRFAGDASWERVDWEVGIPVDISSEGIPGVRSITDRPIDYDICALGTWVSSVSTSTPTPVDHETILLFGERGWFANHPQYRRARLDPSGFHRSDFETWNVRLKEAIRLNESRTSLLKRIAIVGGGEAGSALYDAFVASGFPTTLGDHHHPETKPEAVPTEEATSPDDVDVVILAVPTESLGEVIERLDFRGKIVIDVTNPAGPQLAHAPPPGSQSNGEFVAKHARGVRAVFKAFNDMGAGSYTKPVSYPSGIRKDLYICGTEGEDKRWLMRVCRQILGFNPVDLGEIEYAHLTEQHANFWMQLAKGPAKKGMNFGFTTVE